MTNENARRRPYMRNYGIAETAEGLMSWAWVDEQMAKSRSYWVCSTRPDGRPHAAPVWGVWFEGTLYFSTDRGARKARNLAANPAVVVHLESGDDSVIFEGVVEEIADMELLRRVGKAYAAKYPPYDPVGEGMEGALWYALRPQSALAWLEKDFPNTATRWDFGK
jgi:hypothetical protein